MLHPKPLLYCTVLYCGWLSLVTGARHPVSYTSQLSQRTDPYCTTSTVPYPISHTVPLVHYPISCTKYIFPVSTTVLYRYCTASAAQYHTLRYCTVNCAVQQSTDVYIVPFRRVHAMKTHAFLFHSEQVTFLLNLFEQRHSQSLSLVSVPVFRSYHFQLTSWTVPHTTPHCTAPPPEATLPPPSSPSSPSSSSPSFCHCHCHCHVATLRILSCHFLLRPDPLALALALALSLHCTALHSISIVHRTAHSCNTTPQQNHIKIHSPFCPPLACST